MIKQLQLTIGKSLVSAITTLFLCTILFTKVYCQQPAVSNFTFSPTVIVPGYPAPALPYYYYYYDTIPTILQGQTVNFTDLSTNNPTKWRWYFTMIGMTGTINDTTQNPSFQFTSSGFYRITCQSKNSFNPYYSVNAKWIYVIPATPIVNFSPYEDTIYYGDSIQFTEQSVVPPGIDTAVQWEWDFGDYQTSTLRNPVHKFSYPGNFSVRHRAKNSFGWGEWKSAYPKKIKVLSSMPTSNFSSNTTNVAPGDSVNFIDLSTVPLSNYPVTSWFWSFPGGVPSSSTAQNPTVTYNTMGSYKVILTTKNAMGTGTTKTVVDYIWVTTKYVWTGGGANNNWNTNGNWNLPNYPGYAADNPEVEISGGSGNPIVNGDYTITSITVTGKTLTINDGKILTVKSNANFNNATILAGSGTNGIGITVNQTLTCTNSTFLSGTSKTLYLTGTNLLLSGNTFNGKSVSIIKQPLTGIKHNYWAGGNTFGKDTDIKISNQSDSSIYMANVTGDSYPSGSGTLTFELYDENTYGDDRYKGRIYPAYNGGAQTFGNGFSVVFDYEPSYYSYYGPEYDPSWDKMGIYFGDKTGSAILPSGKNIDVSNFQIGILSLKNFTQLGTSTNNSLITSPYGGESIVVFGPNSSFEGKVNCTAGTIQFNGCNFSNSSVANTFETTVGHWKFDSEGGNIFGSVAGGTTTTFKYLGSSSWNEPWVLAKNSQNIFNNNVIFTVDGTNGSGAEIIVSYGQPAQFNGNIELNSTAFAVPQGGGYSAEYDSPNGITIWGADNAHATLAAGKTIKAGSSGIKDGYIDLTNFDQLGTTPQNINASVTALNYDIGGVYPGIYLENTNWGATAFSYDLGYGNIKNSVFNGTFTCNVLQTDGNDITSSGNIYKGEAKFINNTEDNSWCDYGAKYASAVYTSDAAADLFESDVLFQANGESAYIYASCTGTTYYKGNITFDIAGSATEIDFGAGGESILSAGKTIDCTSLHGGLMACGYGDADNGYLYINDLTQLGNTTQTLTGTNKSYIEIYSSTFNGDLNVSANEFYIDQSVFNGASTTFKSTTDGWGIDEYSDSYTQKNKFNSLSTTFESNGFGKIKLSSDSLNGNVTVKSNTLTGGIYFGEGTGTTYLKEGKTITPTSFNQGTLSFKNFIQGNTVGGTSQTFTLTGSATALYDTGSRFYGSVNSTSPHILLNGGTFESTTTITRSATSSGSDKGSGGNTFNGVTTITNNSNATADTLLLAGTTGDTFNNDVTFTKNANGPFQPAANGINSFKKNITVNGSSTSSIVFGATGGIVLIDGTTAQSINRNGSVGMPLIKKLTINKTSENLTLNTAVDIDNTLDLTKGLILTTSTNIITLYAGAISTEGNSTSFVSGPMKKIGNTDFIFPVGDINGSVWARCGIMPVSGHTITDAYTAQYYGTAYSNTTSMGAGVNNVSVVEYWDINKNSGSASVKATLYWENQNRSGILNTPMSDLIVAHFTGGSWKNEGQVSIPGAGPSGSVTSNAFSTFSPFSFGSSGVTHPLPITILSFTGENQGAANLLKWATASETNNDYFTIERSIDAVNFTAIGTMDGAGHSTETLNYEYLDETPFEGINYYRLKQTDFDGTSTYSDIISLNNNNIDEVTIGFFPNPASSADVINVSIGGELLNSSFYYSVYNSLGQKLYEGNMEHSGKYSVHSLPNSLAPGTYWITIVTNNKTDRQKLIIK